ncbi:uncharacterized protein TNCV_4068771 [Trichonephila clavipes]|nr:uncharacterized protein TNCV_4068771 [Trichonephila clavipes]
MTSSGTEIITLNRKRGNIKCQLTKMANALQKQMDLSIPELQAKLDVVLKLQEKFDLLKNDYYKITNEAEYAEVKPVLNLMKDYLQDFELRLPPKVNFWEERIWKRKEIMEAEKFMSQAPSSVPVPPGNNSSQPQQSKAQLDRPKPKTQPESSSSKPPPSRHHQTTLRFPSGRAYVHGEEDHLNSQIWQITERKSH